MGFKPTYLYIKTHNKTGLKYFGKTTRQDPYEYTGSGKYWKRHLKKHGNDITTEILGFYITSEECSVAASDFSNQYNIVESKEWANFKIENGLDGWSIGDKHTDETKNKISKAMKGKLVGDKNPYYKKTHSAEIRRKMGAAKEGKHTGANNHFYGKTHSEETKHKIKDKRKDQIITEETKLKMRNKFYIYFEGIGFRKCNKELLPLYIDQGWIKKGISMKGKRNG